MIYLYHRIPKNVEGNILYPLNRLKEKHPATYEQAAAKYIGREHVKELRIPVLDCLWNDVLHFSSVHPKEIKQALVEAGRNVDLVTMNCYQIDPKLIEPQNAIVYLYAQADYKDKMNEENFVPYNPDEIAKFSEMPQATKDYYKEAIAKGEEPLLYHKIPHILYKGTVDITNLPIISV